MANKRLDAFVPTGSSRRSCGDSLLSPSFFTFIYGEVVTEESPLMRKSTIISDLGDYSLPTTITLPEILDIYNFSKLLLCNTPAPDSEDRQLWIHEICTPVSTFQDCYEIESRKDIFLLQRHSIFMGTFSCILKWKVFAQAASNWTFGQNLVVAHLANDQRKSNNNLRCSLSCDSDPDLLFKCLVTSMPLFFFWSVKNLVNFPVLLLTILSTVPGNLAFWALLQLFSSSKAVPA